MKNYRITVNGTAYDVAVEEIGAGAAPAVAAPAAAPTNVPRSLPCAPPTMPPMAEPTTAPNEAPDKAPPPILPHELSNDKQHAPNIRFLIGLFLYYLDKT